MADRREGHIEPAGFHWPIAVQNDVDGIVAECGGNCQCATCHVYVEEKFLPLLKPMAEDENAMLESTASPRKYAGSST